VKDIPVGVGDQSWRDDWRIALDEQRLITIHAEVAEAARRVLTNKISAFPNIELRLENAEVKASADVAFESCIYEYFSSWFPDPIFDEAELAIEATASVKQLKRCKKIIQKMPVRGQLLLSELNPYDLESVLDSSIQWLEKDFASKTGRKKYFQLENALKHAVVAFEVMTGRAFKKNFKKDRGNPTNADLQFFHTVMQTIDPAIETKSIDSKLKKLPIRPEEKLKKSRKARKKRRQIEDP
jgi:hypothetical protein